MGYTALYRKFRPDHFEDVRGQDHVVTTLRNQIQANRIGHAFLFCGTRGTGKTSVAKILARAVNCEHPVNGSPCNVCPTCRGILDGTLMNVIEIDAASNNGVDNIREIREEVAYRPTQGKYKVYIIDEVHMLSTGAFNALLKTLEEPPSYVIFILATTEAHRIPVTILSRCQRYDFHRISVDTIAERLRELTDIEGVQAEEKALRYVAKAADGSMRDALSLLDQCIAFYLGQELTGDRVLEVLGTVDTGVFSRMLRQVMAGDVTGCLATLDKMIIRGKDPGQFVADFTWYLRNMLLLITSDDAEEILDVSRENLALMREEAEFIDADTLMRYIRVLAELSNRLRTAVQKRVAVEIALIRLCRPAMETNLDSVLDRIRVLEKKVEEGYMPRERIAAGTPGDPEEAGTDALPAYAAPEDIQRAVGEWPAVVAQTDGMFKSFLRTARPKYDGAGGDGKFYVVFRNNLAQKYLDDDNARGLLEGIIEKRIGKHVDVVFALEEQSESKRLSEVPIDDRIRQMIHMDVATEEMEDDEF